MGPDPEQVNATKKATRGRIKREVEGNQVHSPYAAHENSDPYSAERAKQSAVIIAGQFGDSCFSSRKFQIAIFTAILRKCILP